MGIGNIADIADGGDIAIHGIDTFERHQFRRGFRQFRQHAAQIRHIIMLEQNPLRFAVTYAFNHGGVVHFIGNDNAARNF